MDSSSSSHAGGGIQGRPLCALAPEEARAAQDAARTRLRELGAPSALKKASGVGGRKKLQGAHGSSAGASTPGPKTPGRQGSHARRVFCRPLRDLSMVLAPELGEDVLVPKVLAFLCDWLRGAGGDRLGCEGLFRKPGSANRQRMLKSSLEESEAWTEALSDASPLDVAGLVKQWLRELPEPLMPVHLQKLLLECWEFPDKESRTEGLLLCCCLLPANHANTLMYLSRFLSEVAARSEENKMDEGNLAIVLTPAFFPMDEGASAAGKKGGTHDKLPQMMQIVESVIKMSREVGYLTASLENVCAETASQPISCHSEDNLDDDDDEAVPGHGPSARRVKKKKRRSGSISRVFSATVKGIQKAMSRSATPVAPRGRYEGMEPPHATPLPLSLSSAYPPVGGSARFASPRLPAKRKAKEESELSPRSKQQRKIAAMDMTPKMRGRSFSVKRFKQHGGSNKSFKLSADDRPPPPPPATTTVLHNFSPLASRPSLKIGTPSTPAQLGIPRQATDIVTPPSDNSSLEGEEEEEAKKAGKHNGTDTNVEEINSSMASLMTVKSGGSSTSSLSSCATIRSRASLATAWPRQRSASPKGRKIGAMRRRSQETAATKKTSETSLELHPPPRHRATSKPALQTIPVDDMRAHLRRGSLHHAPGNTPGRRGSRTSPLRVPPTVHSSASSSKSSSAVKTSAKKSSSSRKKLSSSHQESLSNLRQDISSFIEQSFGAGGGGNVSGVDAFDTVDTSGIFARPPAPTTSAAQGAKDDDENFRRNIMRRQSSAFEFSRPPTESAFFPGAAGAAAPGPELRRQSSAFEIAARNRKRHPHQSYQAFDRVATRASLRRKSSSVRDLVLRLEASAKKKDTTQTQPQLRAPQRKRNESMDSSSSSSNVSKSSTSPLEAAETEAEETERPQDEADAEEWTDAAEFFKNPVIPKLLIEEDFGCKRSSIMRIRKENKGKVSQSVECFTRPNMMPPPSTTVVPHRATHATTPVANRRVSMARMGVSSATPNAVSTSVTPLQNRRQTRMGIRTSVNHKHSVSATSAEKRPKTATARPAGEAEEISNSSRTSSSTSTSTSSTRSSVVRTPDLLPKRRATDKRLPPGARRHLTIGYVGEVRSPLADRQNRVASASGATVQRSKSAQTPLESKPNKTKRRAPLPEHENLLLHHHLQQQHLSCHPMVTRSQSMRSPAVAGSGTARVTISLPEGTIAYAGGSGRKKVQRHRSERSAVGVGPATGLLATTAKSPRMVRMY